MFKKQKEEEICNELKIIYGNYLNWKLGNNGYSHLDKDNTYSADAKQKFIIIINEKLKPFMNEFDEKNKEPKYIEYIDIPSVPLVPSSPDLYFGCDLPKDHKNYDISQKCKKIKYIGYHGYDLPSMKKIKEIIEEYKKEYAKNYDETFNKHYEEYRIHYYESILKKYFINCGWVRKKENQYSIQFSIIDTDSAMCCELKPTLSDEYPCVLRKLKTQIELTYKDKTTFQYLHKKYTLIIGSFTSTSASKEQLITIFKQSNINIVFTDEIFASSAINTIQSINTESLSFDKKLVQENKNLSDNLLQTQQKLLDAEERIKQLEEEILSLKSQKQSTKTIKDYFVKK